MKIRKGFVSNSSSSSFIVHKSKEFSNTIDLGRRMLNIRNEDWYPDEIIASNELLKLDEASNLGVDSNINISFPTINYRTYIWSASNDTNNIWVSTCNNHPWELGLGCTGIEDSWNYQIENTYFWFLDTGAFGKPITEEEWLKFKNNNKQFVFSSYRSCWLNRLHNEDIILDLDKKIICVECFKEPDIILSNLRKIRYNPEYIPKRSIKFR